MKAQYIWNITFKSYLQTFKGMFLWKKITFFFCRAENFVLKYHFFTVVVWYGKCKILKNCIDGKRNMFIKLKLKSFRNNGHPNIHIMSTMSPLKFGGRSATTIAKAENRIRLTAFWLQYSVGEERRGRESKRPTHTFQSKAQKCSTGSRVGWHIKLTKV